MRTGSRSDSHLGSVEATKRVKTAFAVVAVAAAAGSERLSVGWRSATKRARRETRLGSDSVGSGCAKRLQRWNRATNVLGPGGCLLFSVLNAKKGNEDEEGRGRIPWLVD